MDHIRDKLDKCSKKNGFLVHSMKAIGIIDNDLFRINVNSA